MIKNPGDNPCPSLCPSPLYLSGGETVEVDLEIKLDSPVNSYELIQYPYAFMQSREKSYSWNHSCLSEFFIHLYAT